MSSPVEKQESPPAGAGLTLTELGGEVELPQEVTLDDEEEDKPADDEEGAPGPAQEEQEDDDEDDEDDEEEGSDNDRPKKRKRRRRGGNQFIDIEAEVDDDEEEDDEDGEEGFVQNDDFIVNRPERRSGDLNPLLPLGDGDDDEGDADGDASHRRLDRRLMKQKDREAEELAASFQKKYRANRYDAEGADEWAPKALLLPGVNDPSIWGVKCKTGRERDLIMNISRKAATLAASDHAAPLRIISAFHRDSIKGIIYVEARSEDYVREAVRGLAGVYLQTKEGTGIFLVGIDEMAALLKTKQKSVEIKPGGWARIRRGKYAGDLAQIVEQSENADECTIRFIPRIDLTPKDDAGQTGPDGKKRKKGASMPVAFRPPPRFFNPEEIGKVFGKREVAKRPGGILVFRNDTYKEGYCEKDIRLTGLSIEDVQPTIDELTRFLGEDANNAEGGLDLSSLSDAARKSATGVLRPSDSVEVFEGDQNGLWGTVLTIRNEIITVLADPSLDDYRGLAPIEVNAKMVRKRFLAGDHVKVMAGNNIDETGLVTAIKDDVVTFLSDLSLQEISVFSKDVRKAAEVGSGVNVIGQYELHDLVQLDPQTTGVIFRIERDLFRILDQSGSVRSLKPSQVGIKINSRDAVAVDQEGYDIRVGDTMKEVTNRSGQGRTGTILHIYRSSFAFLHSRDIPDNGGVFVTYARSLTSTVTRGAQQRPKSIMLNPNVGQAQGGASAAQGTATAMIMRRDGRIDRKVAVTRGQYKGSSGIIKDVIGINARVELYTSAKVVNVPLEQLKEQKPDGTLIPLLERPGGGPGYGGRQNGGGGGGAYSREGSTFSNASSGYGQPSAQQGGKTPFPAFGGRTPGWSGGRTPAPAHNGGQTPSGGKSGSSWDASARTPGYTGGSAAWSASSRTPAHPSSASSSDSWNPSSRTPAYPSASSSSDAWNASSRTPFHPGASGSGINDGGRTPDARAGAKTPGYGGRAAYSNGDRGEPVASAPTPGSWDDDSWGTTPSAPTPGPKPHDYSANPPTPSWGAPTPAATAPTPYPTAPTPYGAPTPYTAPTPYGSAPTPAAPTPGAYSGAPTPGGYSGAPTPGVFAAPTPGYSATPAAYGGPSGAPTGSASLALPVDWLLTGIKVTFNRSGFQDGQFTDQRGYIQKCSNGLASVVLENHTVVQAVPASALLPQPPSSSRQDVIVLAGPHRTYRALTVSRDGNDWMVDIAAKHEVYDERILALKA